MSDHAVINTSALTELVEMTGGDPAFLDELLDTFVADTSQLLAAMRQALADSNAVELRRAAHSLKSNSATFGALRLAGLCQELEDRGQNNDLVGADQVLAQIEAEYPRVESALRDAQTTI